MGGEDEGEADSIPILTIDDLYVDAEAAMPRYNIIKDTFIKKFDCVPEFYARVPGRVTLIGDMIDFTGYGVLPMCIEQDLIIAVSINYDNKLRIGNTNIQFGFHEEDVSGFEIRGRSWYKFILCGIKGVLDEFHIDSPIGMNLMIDGNIPKSAGLASSSSLVCCAAITTIVTNQVKNYTRLQLAELCSRYERLAGAEVGEMDHAIGILGESGKAQFINFQPTSLRGVALPPDVCFVVAHSLVEITKADNPSVLFNVRVAESQLSARVLAKKLGLDWRSVIGHKSVQLRLGQSLTQMICYVKDHLHTEPYTREEITDYLGLNEKESEELFLKTEVDVFKLRQRSLHIYSEAYRVIKFKQICENRSESCLLELGKLLNESHASLRDDFENCCDEVEELVSICRDSGAIGSRLIGAGWGGFTLSLISDNFYDEFVNRITNRYYNRTEKRKSKIKGNIFCAIPQMGAALIYGSIN